MALSLIDIAIFYTFILFMSLAFFVTDAKIEHSTTSCFKTMELAIT